MADRIIGMRTKLRENLENLGSPLPWEHVTKQVRYTIKYEYIYEVTHCNQFGNKFAYIVR